ncbi:hypothetical protein BV898_04981 [Hypsibius exemplaris]|uniref:Receptor ligand binding region domain-containing protein n=1 Tax=Hypsibius exemplaris TaxID=2072580 RepID=A0A1W0X0A4_HYPEX|nr:hypothetical protein BV898_04981 [Hypsibius exemplaris]
MSEQVDWWSVKEQDRPYTEHRGKPSGSCGSGLETCPGFFNPSSNAALAFHAPAFDAAISDLNRIYSGAFNFTLTYIIDAAKPSGVSAIITPGGVDITNVMQLTASWNILYISTLASDKSEYRLPAPAVLGTTYISLPSIGMAFTNCLALNKWSTALIVIDSDSPPFYRLIAREIDGGVSSLIHKYSIASRTRETFRDVLSYFRTISRVLFFLGRADLLRRLLIEASSLNMTNGEFVYVYTEPYPRFNGFGVLSWQYGDDHDKAAREAFGSLLIIHPLTALSDISEKAVQYGSRFRKSANCNYNISYAAVDQPIREVLTSYSTVSMFAQVLNETLHQTGTLSLHDGRQLSRRFLNRTFQDGLVELVMDEDGARRVILAVSHYAGANRSEEQPFAVQSKELHFKLQIVRDISDSWPGSVWPPPNEPRCGYNDEKAVCHQVSGLSHITTLIMLILLTCMFMSCIAILSARKYLHHKELFDMWWRLGYADFSFAESTVEKSKVALRSALVFKSSGKLGNSVQ